MFESTHNAALGAGSGTVKVLLVLAPYVAGIGILLFYWSWLGIFSGVAAFWLLRKGGQPITAARRAGASLRSSR